MNANVVKFTSVTPLDLGGGVTRRVLAYNDQMMTVQVSFETGGEGSAHSHPHCQNTYILSGRFRFTVDGEDVEVTQGDTLAIPPNAVHATLCLEKGELLDIFTPMRKDFV